MDILVAPIYMILTGNFYNILQRWKLEKNTPRSDAEKIKNWVYPPEWTSSNFLPNRFERYITCFYGHNLERELGLDENHSKLILKFPERAKEPKSPFSDENYEVLNCTCLNKKANLDMCFKKRKLILIRIVKLWDKIWLFIVLLANIVVGSKCNHTEEDIDNIEYLDVCDSEIVIKMLNNLIGIKW